MRERTDLAGGQMAVDSRPGEGTHIVVRLPVGDMQDD
jgi:signal transduction histidine kinase